jgi:dTDP-4-dehydrorhamnose 3,5-epimerase
MIDGVKIKKLKAHPDKHVEGEEIVKEPGFLIEILRDDENLLKKFGQSLMTLTHKGTIKAFHSHKLQDDHWFFATGKVKVVLYDTRESSSTFKETQVIEAGARDYKLITIPAGIAHGYKVLSDEPAILFYHVTELYDYDNPDEIRIPYNDKEINFNWEKI